MREWARLIDAGAKVEIVAIVNPASGPGRERNPDYTAIFTSARLRGITLIGYVSTDYTKRPVTDVRSDVDRWTEYYPQIGGFFFDQQPSEEQHASYYALLRDYARSKLANALVIDNPGVPCDLAYLAKEVSNVTCVFANFEGFERFELPRPLRVYDPPRFAALPYNIATEQEMRSVVKDAIVKRIGYLFVTDARPPNQWNRLPSYWEAEVDEIARNQ
jgi:Spherulation-specific family 4